MPEVPEKMKDELGRRQALKKVGHAREQLEKAQRQHRNMIRFASDVGASLREIAEAAGVSHQTVKNILEGAD